MRWSRRGDTDDVRLSKRDAMGRDGLFLAYRRSDAGPWVGRLADDLREYFGRDKVYRDLDSNVGGEDYVVKIERWLHHARVVMPVIGPEWMMSPAGDGISRLHDPVDLHRREIDLALASGAAVLPVLVGGAQMPAPDQLPDSLRPLSRLQAQRMSDEDWDYDLGRLLDALEARGILASRGATVESASRWSSTKQARYSRTFRAPRRRAFDAVVGAVEMLGYRDRNLSIERAQITFRAAKRTVLVKATDAGPGSTAVIVELATMKSGVLGGASVVAGVTTAGIALGALPALRLWERRFATGFLDNVESVLDGRGISSDSALLPGVERFRNRIDEV